jgi:hypothetical protein
MDKDTLKIVVATQVYVFGYLLAGFLLFFLLLPILLRVCSATSATLTFIEYVIRLVLVVIIFVAMNYTRKKLMLVTKDFMSKNTLMSSSLKPLRDMIIACSVTMIGLVFFLTPHMFGLNTPTLIDYLLSIIGNYNIGDSALDSCWLAKN